jgi:microcystin-dependent protein
MRLVAIMSSDRSWNSCVSPIVRAVNTKIAYAFLDEGVGGDKFEAFKLPKVGVLAHHIDKE